MIVEEPPYDLVALFACEDQRRLVSSLIERGQQSGCLRELRWRALRDPRRDQLCQRPEALLAPFITRAQCRLLIAWDHEGSGREREEARGVEADVVMRLSRGGVARDNVLAICFEPELESTFSVVWDRVLDLLARERGTAPPEERALVALLRRRGHPAESVAWALERKPKDLLEAAIELVGLRRSPALYEALGAELSIPRLKQDDALGRIARGLEAWFGIELATPTTSDSR